MGAGPSPEPPPHAVSPCRWASVAPAAATCHRLAHLAAVAVAALLLPPAAVHWSAARVAVTAAAASRLLALTELHVVARGRLPGAAAAVVRAAPPVAVLSLYGADMDGPELDALS